MSKDTNKGFLGGAIIGGIIAAIAALLFAPKSGKETREEIAGKAKKVAADISKELHVAHNEIQKRLTKLKAAAKDLKGEAAQDAKVLIKKTEALRDDLKVAAANIGEATSDVKAELADNAKMLLKSSSQVLNELESFSKKLASNASSQAKKVVK